MIESQWPLEIILKEQGAAADRRWCHVLKTLEMFPGLFIRVIGRELVDRPNEMSKRQHSKV
jgi:hypothetical protein